MQRKEFVATLFLFSVLSISFSQGSWIQKTNFGGVARQGAVGFSIGSKGYMGTGDDVFFTALNDFWEWDQATDTWTQKGNFLVRGWAVGFSIGNKGYIGTGSNVISSSTNWLDDFWEWDQATGSWTQKASLPGVARSTAVGFSIGNKGYIGTGQFSYSASPQTVQDFWEWNQATNTWIQKANFGGGVSGSAVGFSIGTKGYIGTGGYPFVTSDFWEWEQATNVWTQKANFGGAWWTNPDRNGAVGFSIGSYGYAGTGSSSAGVMDDWWRYDPFSNTWTQMANFAGGKREFAAGFSIGCKGYIGTGWLNDTNYTNYKDFWEYTPDSIGSTILATAYASTSTLCAGQTATLTGCCGVNYSWSNGATTNPAIVTVTSTTTYSLIASDVCDSDTAVVTVIITPYPVLSIANTTICAGQNATLNAISTPPSTGYAWNTGATTSSIIINPPSATTYSVIASIWQCKDTAIGTVTVNPNPTSNAGNNVTIDFGSSTTLIGAGGGTYFWNTGSSSDSSFVSPTATTTYSLIVTDANGCTDIAIVTVFVNELKCPIYLPNAFSPNGDDENDFFKLYYNPICLKSAFIVIYDYWGQKVFESADKDFKWDGTFEGEKFNTGVFVYYLNVSYWQYEDKTAVLKGNVSLLR